MAMYQLFRPLLFRLDPEDAHQLTLRLLSITGSTSIGRMLLRLLYSQDRQGLSVNLFGLKFPNPVGLAAGYDKDGLGAVGLACLGFGHLELGTVTPNPQPGNPRPRIFRLPEDQALINRMGFPNAGAAALHRRLRRKKPMNMLIGVNIGKGADTAIANAVEDYVGLLRIFYGVADYIAINVSSPNTIGLRRLQARQQLDMLLAECSLEREALQAESGKRVPMLLKLAPDLSLSEIDDALDVLLTHGIDGVIATNTTIARDELKSKFAEEIGGLSGAPLRWRSLKVVAHIHKVTSGRLPVIGVGGIFGAEQVKEMLDSGASLVQTYTGLVYRGPGLVREILRELSA